MIEIRLDPRAVTRWMAAFITLLVFLSVVSVVGRQWTSGSWKGGLFHLDVEGNLPSWAQSMMLLMSAVLLAYAGVLESRSPGDKRHWRFLAMVFFLMSLDEMIALHERLIRPLRTLFQTDGYLYFAWLIAAVPFVLFVFIMSLGFLKRLRAEIRRGFLAAGTVYLAGAVLMELVGGHIYTLYGRNSWPYVASVHVEETLEMAGIAIFIRYLLIHLTTVSGTDRFSLGPVRKSP